MIGLALFLCAAIFTPYNVDALPYDFELSLEDTNCHGCTGNLFFTVDGTQVSWDVNKLVGTQINTLYTTYSIIPGSFINSEYLFVYGTPTITFGLFEHSWFRIGLQQPYPASNTYELEFTETMWGDVAGDLITTGGMSTHDIPLSHSVPEPSILVLLSLAICIFYGMKFVRPALNH